MRLPGNAVTTGLVACIGLAGCGNPGGQGYPRLLPFDTFAQPAAAAPETDGLAGRVAALKARAALLTKPVMTEADRAALVR